MASPNPSSATFSSQVLGSVLAGILDLQILLLDELRPTSERSSLVGSFLLIRMIDRWRLTLADDRTRWIIEALFEFTHQFFTFCSRLFFSHWHQEV